MKEVKNEFLFLDHTNLTIHDITEKIKNVILEDTTILYKRGNLNEWITLDERYLISSSDKPRYVEFVKYVDEMYSTLFDKLQLINTLANMIVVSSIPIAELDINNLFILVDYFKDIKAKEYDSQYKVLKNENILKQVRLNTLDTNQRTGLLRLIVELAKKNNIDVDNSEQVNNYLAQIQNLLQTKQAEEILNQ